MTTELYEAWNTVYLGRHKIPAPCMVKVSITHPVRVAIRMVFLTPREWRRVRKFVDRIWPKKGGVKSFAVRTPECQARAVRRLVITGIGMPTRGPFPGSKAIRIRAVQA